MTNPMKWFFGGAAIAIACSFFPQAADLGGLIFFLCGLAAVFSFMTQNAKDDLERNRDRDSD